MRLDNRNEPQPGEADRPEAPVIWAWPVGQRWNYVRTGYPIPYSPYGITSASQLIDELRQWYPGHTINLSAEPPEGITR